MAQARSSAPPRPLLVELVGPPGAGKSTVFERLLNRDERFEPRPILMRRSYAGLVAGNFALALLQLLRSRVLRRTLWGELQALTYLRTLPRYLDDRPAERVVIFDQGPIYILSRPELLDKRLARWWAPTFATWSSALDLVVSLDAPDAVLIGRIDTRSKVHRVKNSGAELAGEFLAASRAGYDDIMRRLGEQASGPTILRFDTSRRSADEVVDEVVATLARLRPGSDGRTAPTLS